MSKETVRARTVLGDQIIVVGVSPDMLYFLVMMMQNNGIRVVTDGGVEIVIAAREINPESIE